MRNEQVNRQAGQAGWLAAETGARAHQNIHQLMPNHWTFTLGASEAPAEHATRSVAKSAVVTARAMENRREGGGVAGCKDAEGYCVQFCLDRGATHVRVRVRSACSALGEPDGPYCKKGGCCTVGGLLL